MTDRNRWIAANVASADELKRYINELDRVALDMPPGLEKTTLLETIQKLTDNLVIMRSRLTTLADGDGRLTSAIAELDSVNADIKKELARVKQFGEAVQQAAVILQLIQKVISVAV